MTITNDPRVEFDSVNTFLQRKLFYEPTECNVFLNNLKSHGYDGTSPFVLDRDNPVFGVLYDDVQEYVEEVNEKFFNFDIEGFEPFSIHCHDSTTQQLPHDIDGVRLETGKHRKLSVMLLLTDPSEYKGWELEFLQRNGTTRAIQLTQGSLLVYSSAMPYRISPVTEGKNTIVIGRVLGPAFR